MSNLLQESSLEKIKAWTWSFSEKVMKGRSSEMFLIWKRQVLYRCLMWFAEVSCGSSFTPRVVTVGESGMSLPEKEMPVMGDPWN